MLIFNTDIEIDLEHLPKLLRSAYLNLKEYYDNEQLSEFMCLNETFEAAVKQCYIDKKITKKQLDDLFYVIGLY